MLQPPAQKLQQLHRNRRPTRVEVLLEFQHLLRQGFVLGAMGGEFRVIVETHEPFLVREVDRRVLNQTAQDSR
jgi:hypothetical protein